MQRLVWIVVLIVVMSAPLRSQSLVNQTAIDFGLSTQKLIHLSAHYFVSDQVFVEAGLGALPRLAFMNNSMATYSLGVSYLTNWTAIDASGPFYSLLYSFLTQKTYNTDNGYNHILTANIGHFSQGESGWTFLLRAGVGIIQTNTPTYTITDFGETERTDYERGLHPWLNLEATIGFAF